MTTLLNGRSFDPEPFRARRRRLLERMRADGGGLAAIASGQEVARNRDAMFPFRADSYFHYLSGFPEPDATLVLVADAASPAADQCLLFCRARDEERELWDGLRYGHERAAITFGLDGGGTSGELPRRLAELLPGRETLWSNLCGNSPLDQLLHEALDRVRENARAGQRPPRRLVDLNLALDDMRLVKDDTEIATMREACAIAARAHRAAMRATRPGKMEYEIEAELLKVFRAHGAAAPAYTSIVAGGANACILHYVANDQALQDGDLLLIDAGCEFDGYASDITRTFPVSGRFNPAQADLYQLVLAAQQAARQAIRPGARWNDAHEAAVRVLARGFIDFRLCRGTVDAVIESGDYKRFYMHRTGHWLGIDVHDAGDYKEADGSWRQLEAGMVCTIEPGCYIRPGDDVPRVFHNIGIRIEDDALVTATGCELLTDAVPRAIVDIEALMAEAADA